MAATLVIADIHANHWALKAVLDNAARFAYDEIWFLGDLWGYGPTPDLVWKTLFDHHSHLPIRAVLGNHDWRICGVPAGAMRPEAFAVAKMHQRILRKSAIEFVRSLPVMYSPRSGVYLAHGAVAATCEESIRIYQTYPPIQSPQDMVKDFYRAQEERYGEKVKIDDNVAQPTARIFAVGQTHVQKLWEWDPETAAWCEKSARHYIWENLEERPVLFNPGSVGFPRADSGCPGYAMINWETCSLSFHRVMYDTKALKQEMQWPPYQTLIENPNFFIDPHCEEMV